jgi:hypothetical protein
MDHKEESDCDNCKLYNTRFGNDRVCNSYFDGIYKKFIYGKTLKSKLHNANIILNAIIEHGKELGFVDDG